MNGYKLSRTQAFLKFEEALDRWTIFFGIKPVEFEHTQKKNLEEDEKKKLLKLRSAKRTRHVYKPKERRFMKHGHRKRAKENNDQLKIFHRSHLKAGTKKLFSKNCKKKGNKLPRSKGIAKLELDRWTALYEKNSKGVAKTKLMKLRSAKRKEHVYKCRSCKLMESFSSSRRDVYLEETFNKVDWQTAIT